MSKKYEFTGEILNHYGRKLHRIRALVDIANAAAEGDLGGWIESEDNLSHEGCAWVFDNAKVYDKAFVSDNAKVSRNAEIYDNAAICGNARVYGDAKVYGNAEVYGNAAICDNAKVHENAFVYGNTAVYGHAEVHGAAKVHGIAHVCGNTWVDGKAILRDGSTDKTQFYICVGPIGSRNGYTTLNLTSGTVCTGCFKGTIDEFEAAVKKAHGNNDHAANYAEVIDYFRARITRNQHSRA